MEEERKDNVNGLFEDEGSDTSAPDGSALFSDVEFDLDRLTAEFERIDRELFGESEEAAAAPGEEAASEAAVESAAVENNIPAEAVVEESVPAEATVEEIIPSEADAREERFAEPEPIIPAAPVEQEPDTAAFEQAQDIPAFEQMAEPEAESAPVQAPEAEETAADTESAQPQPPISAPQAIETEIAFDDLEWEDEPAPAAPKTEYVSEEAQKAEKKKRDKDEKKTRKLEKSVRKAQRAEEKELAFAENGSGSWLYDTVYDFGLGVIHTVTALFTALFRLFAKPVKAFIKAAGYGKKREPKKAFGKIRQEITALKAELKNAKAGFIRVYRDPARRRRLMLHYVGLGIKNHRYLLKTALNTLLPLGAAVIYLITSSYWNSVTFALEVTYQNRSLGYINDESVYLEAQNLIKEKMDTGAYAFVADGVENNADAVSLDAEYKLKLVSLDELNDADTICDKVIESSADSLTSACGVYVDDIFLGAVKNEADARTVFDSVLAPYEQEAEEQDYVVGFAENVRYLQGLYSDVDGIIVDGARLAEKLEQGQYLHIQKTVTSTETVEVPFEVLETKDYSKYQGYSMVTKEGVNGISRVTTTKIYVDDELTAAEKETTVIREPVPEERTVGGKGYYGGGWVGSPSSSGFLWPAPSCSYISSPYGYRSSGFHKGTDICRAGGGANGTAVIASRAGTVEYAGYSNVGYGYMVLINHGDGYKTRYGHMQANSLCVSVGEEVYAGQQLGRIGSTGNSTGPHLHFEVIYYGEYKNPMNYLDR